MHGGVEEEDEASAVLTLSKQVSDESSQSGLQVELQQLHSLQRVSFLFVRRPPASGLKQGQLFPVLHPREQLEDTSGALQLYPTHDPDERGWAERRQNDDVSSLAS